MHWSTRRALATIAKQGHARLDEQLLDAVALDETAPSEVARLRNPVLPRTGEPREPLPVARPARQRELVDRS
jgi:hypothetical protein